MCNGFMSTSCPRFLGRISAYGQMRDFPGRNIPTRYAKQTGCLYLITLHRCSLLHMGQARRFARSDISCWLIPLCDSSTFSIEFFRWTPIILPSSHCGMLSDWVLSSLTAFVYGSMTTCWVHVSDTKDRGWITNSGSLVSSLGKPFLSNFRYVGNTVVMPVLVSMIQAANVYRWEIIRCSCRQVPAWINCNPRCIAEGLAVQKERCVLTKPSWRQKR